MGGSGSGAADCTPGSIVWVRRRNGSWWPGRILGPEELGGDSPLTSPRAGTPVKLLGREDASVDWYNLEKSKRVKAFRCDEFNDCIKKVESSQAMPSKKREKYASREDAILHALELEKQQLRKQGHFDVANNELSVSKRPVAFDKSLPVPLGGKQNGGETELPHVTEGLAAFAKDEIIMSGSYLHNLKDSVEECQEDGLVEGIPRMRRLQDFGLKIAPSKRKYPYRAAMNGFGKPKMNIHAHPIGVPGMRNTYIDGAEEMGVISRAKRSRCIMYLPEERNRFVDDKESYRSKIQISPSTSGEGNPHLLFRGKANRLSDELDGGSSDCYLSESGSDSSSETEQNTNEETSSLSDMSAMAVNKAQEEEAGSMSSEEEDPDGSAPSSMGLGSVSASQAVSKWQLKGKRNIRNLTRQSLDGAGGKGGLIGSNHQVRHPVYREMGFKQKRPTTKWSSHIHIINNNNNNNNNEEEEEEEVDVNEEDWDAAHIFTDYTYTSSPGIASSSRDRSSFLRRHNYKASPPDWEGGTTMIPPLEGPPPAHQQQQHQLVGGGVGRRRGAVLFEVDVKVQVRYPKERVPIVAMTSKVNNSSIIGHSIGIEAVEDGSLDHHLLLSNCDEIASETSSRRIVALPPAWRTARRTANFRVPRPNPTFEGDEDCGEEEEEEEEEEDVGSIYNDDDDQRKQQQPPLKSSSGVEEGVSHQKGFLVRRSLLAQSQSEHSNSNSNSNSNSKRVRKKLSKRVSSSSLPSSSSCKQKVRTLSSIAVQQNNKLRSHNNNNTCSSSRMMMMVEGGGLNEPPPVGSCSRATTTTTVACIPVKLVFSRLLEKINRPPSRAALANLNRLHAHGGVPHFTEKQLS